MLKIGLLYVNNGVYNGTQLLDSDWIEQSSQSWLPTGPGFAFAHSYGFLWWIGGEGSYRYYFANGYGGQFIFILPELDAVIVARSDWDYPGGDADNQWVNTIQIIVNRVIPAINE
jgi:CubicO group peptidase (beta-lactamase class C family)